MTRVFIDGSAGTTGLRIHDRLPARADLELIRLDPALPSKLGRVVSMGGSPATSRRPAGISQSRARTGWRYCLISSTRS